jgi:hypothetical protein
MFYLYFIRQNLLRAGGVDLGKMNKEINSFMETDASVIANTPQELFANDVEGIAPNLQHK